MKKPNIESLKQIAFYLSGLKDGKGNLLPLGTVVLEDLWDAIKYLQGIPEKKETTDTLKQDTKNSFLSTYTDYK